MRLLGLLAFALISAGPVQAGEVEIVDAQARQNGETWTFSVTLRHEDEGWEHYADLWQVIGPDGAVLGERVLLHPHENEQPFTRSLSGVAVPSGVERVTIRARDKRHGFADKTFDLTLR